VLDGVFLHYQMSEAPAESLLCEARAVLPAITLLSILAVTLGHEDFISVRSFQKITFGGCFGGSQRKNLFLSEGK
jgi:hypothetical protein